MRIGALLLFVASGLALLSMELGGPFRAFLWPALAALYVSAAYFLKRPHWLGKRRDGTLSPLHVALLFPFFAFMWTMWQLQRRMGEDLCNEVAPGLWVGRRPLDGELPEDATLVVDLTSEFAEVASVRALPGYRCVPTLDADVPSPEAFDALVEEIAAHGGKAYVHCASGHGRSATVAAAVLVRRGVATNAAEAEALMRKARPSVRLHSVQRRMVDRPRAAPLAVT